jgi:hypothetical protein
VPPVSATRADLLGALAVIVVTAVLALGPQLQARLGAHPSAEECEALVERYVELKERSVSEKIDPKRYGAALEDAKRAAGPSFSACTTQITREELSCTRRANHVDELERCLR